MKTVELKFNDLPDDSIVKELEEFIGKGLAGTKVSRDGKKIIIKSKDDFSKREIKRLAKKYLAKSGFGSSTKVIAVGPDNYTIFYQEEES
ncbi:MAG: 60S ribosomal protein L22 [Candidatus Hodarchaeales archaeon]